MKNILNFLTRLSIINFIFLLIAIVFINYYKSPLTNLNLSNKTQQILDPKTSINLQKATTTSTSQAPKISNQPTPIQKSQNLFSELAMHNIKNDCWIVYSGHIYGITPFFGSHPGGDEIMLKYCGRDATAAFDSKEQSPPNPHSGNAVNLLSQYLIQ